LKPCCCCLPGLFLGARAQRSQHHDLIGDTDGRLDHAFLRGIEFLAKDQRLRFEQRVLTYMREKGRSCPWRRFRELVVLWVGPRRPQLNITRYTLEWFWGEVGRLFEEGTDASRQPVASVRRRAVPSPRKESSSSPASTSACSSTRSTWTVSGRTYGPSTVPQGFTQRRSENKGAA
jgi:hypothetical protein